PPNQHTCYFLRCICVCNIPPQPCFAGLFASQKLIWPLQYSDMWISNHRSPQEQPHGLLNASRISQKSSPTIFRLQPTIFEEMIPPRISIPASLVPHLPLFDSLALLLVVLNLPVFLYTLLHMIYVCYTFVPSSPTSPAFPSFSRTYTPSITTILLADVVITVTISLVWPSLKCLLSEFAHVVFATRLAGGGSKSVGLCTTIVAGVRIIRNAFKIHESTRSPAIGTMWLPGSELTFIDVVKRLQTSILDYCQQIAALHILATFLLDTICGRLHKNQFADPESSSYSYSDNESCTAALTDHSIYQPIWSFLAGTIVRSKLGQNETSAAKKYGFSDSPIFWVHNIGHVDVALASHASVDVLNRLVVAVDNLPWSQISIINQDSEDYDEAADAISESKLVQTRKLAILGLNPATEYSIEITSPDFPDLYTCINFRTTPDQEHVNPNDVFQEASPEQTTTLCQEEMHQESARLNENRQRMKKLRKDNSKTISLMRGELESLKSKCGGTDKGEERAHRRILFLREFVRRIEEELHILQTEIENLRQAIINQKDIESWTKIRWETAQANQEKIESEVQCRISQVDRMLKDITNENSALSSRKDKLAVRNRKLSADIARLKENPDVQGIAMILARRKQRSEITRRRKRLEQEFLEQISRVERSTQEILDGSQFGNLPPSTILLENRASFNP
ncbi:Ubiquitination network signaling protein acrB, partial [Neolecta irregularis DAH-3]